ncbi:hypothetical protein G6M17_08330 [Agrobacterium tumefaciens]|uniref:hypothetical protein n=1 Tax=Rhizobium/Agrobacterium group TaxID=227290 RepID=UPI000ACA667C|nr:MULTISPECIES: hypothetical protein [Rhizobium/Agrobacterium group]MCZ7443167.1 hypothetical protein [Rhizobium rhizogenes]NSZ79152.1 hypothetical protein [Agrobacterium tumefaciens]
MPELGGRDKGQRGWRLSMTLKKMWPFQLLPEKDMAGKSYSPSNIQPVYSIEYFDYNKL